MVWGICLAVRVFNIFRYGNEVDTWERDPRESKSDVGKEMLWDVGSSQGIEYCVKSIGSVGRVPRN